MNIIILLSILSHASLADTQCKPIEVKPLTTNAASKDENVKKVIAWWSKKEPIDEWGEDRSEISAEDITKVDINNDQIDDYVVSQHHVLGARESFIELHIYNENKSIKIPKPNVSGALDKWYYSACPKSFLKCGNITAMNLQVDYEDQNKQTCGLYIFKNNKTEPSCGLEWMNYTLDDSKKYFEAKDYSSAIDNLNNYMKLCDTTLTDEYRVRFYSELMLNSYKMKNNKNCLKYSTLAEKVKTYNSTKFSNSIRYNKNLCLKNLK